MRWDVFTWAAVALLLMAAETMAPGAFMLWLGFAAAAVASGDSRWLLVALGIYLASWLIMGLGVLIAGRAGRERAREILRRRRRLREILLHRRRRREGRDGAGLNPPESDPP